MLPHIEVEICRLDPLPEHLREWWGTKREGGNCMIENLFLLPVKPPAFTLASPPVVSADLAALKQIRRDLKLLGS
jgi:hypothetical protein